jgi:hypothetical protein
MRALIRSLAAVFLLLVLASPGSAQRQPKPSGHWEGTIQVPGMEMVVEVDLQSSGMAAFSGTFGQPVQGIKGLPLSTVVVEGKNVRFVVRGGDAPATFDGVLSDDGTSISGKVEQGGHTVPFTLTRSGDARIAPPPVNAPIGKELEGSWAGTIEGSGRSMRVVLTMTNQPNGTATGTIMSPDGSGIEIPIAMTQKGSSVTIGVTSVGASFVGTLNPEGTELTGQWTQGPVTAPLTFQRSK